ncbi:CHASE2 domain-containing protein [Sulfurimonas sp. SAG-AH-194-C20]|nr:CHASE2 domain-containing protein [Sulfurimonas sp. SAG-AH-194-C20]MDF1878136.1 CHASE2 domain-containing protein [Sulfurimonas sp. SAG-AH-194-C20]
MRLPFVNKAVLQGLFVSFFYVIFLIFNDYFHIINLKITDTDFYLDTIKQINKFDKTRLITTPLYVVEITDSDIQKYDLTGYALPKSIINKILYKYEKSDASLLFLDLDISKPSCIESQLFSKGEFELLDILNKSKKRIILPSLDVSPLYKDINNSLISILSVEYLALDDLSVNRYSLGTDAKESVAFSIYQGLTQNDTNLSESKNWTDEKLSNLIIYKEFDKANSYYSGLSKISLSQFLDDNVSYTDAVLMLGRVDKNSHDYFNTPIGVIPGIYINANAVMSMYYYGEIKSYYLLNALMAFLLGQGFSIAYEYLKYKKYVAENKEDFIAGLGIVIFSLLCIVSSYFLLEYYSIWIDYQKVVFVFTVYEAVKILKESKLLKKGKT